MMHLSFIIPVYNEAGNVTKLHQKIVTMANKIGQTFEIIFIDDGSTDNTLSELKKLKPVTIIQLRRNFGQTAALDAGIKHAKGSYLVTLDGDLQNNPTDVPKMLHQLKNEQLDVVCGWRKNRQDTFSKRFISIGAKWLRSFLIRDGIQDSGCTLRVYKRECFTDINLRGEMHRFIPAILRWHGYKIGECVVQHHPRYSGKTKYNIERALRGFLDMLSIWFFHKYSARPLHFVGSIGLFLITVGGVLGMYLLIMRSFFKYSLSDKITPLLAVFLVILGFQMFISGLMMDLMIRSSDKTFYDVKKIF